MSDNGDLTAMSSYIIINSFSYISLTKWSLLYMRPAFSTAEQILTVYSPLLYTFTNIIFNIDNT
jgi:hypothetical protein